MTIFFCKILFVGCCSLLNIWDGSWFAAVFVFFRPYMFYNVMLLMECVL